MSSGADAISVLEFSTRGQSWGVQRAAAHGADLAQLSVLTLNTWFEPVHQAQRHAGLLAALEASDADVMCLQEVTPELFARLESADWVRESCALAISPSVHTGYGVAILSRLPVERAWELPLSSMMNRALLAIELRTWGERLTVASAHFESTRELRASRINQLHEVFSALEGHAPALLTGDFNFDPSEPEEHALEPSFVDVWPLLRGADAPGYTEDTSRNSMRRAHHGVDKHVRYDRILARLGARWSPSEVQLFGTAPIAEGVFLSDHFGVRARFRRR